MAEGHTLYTMFLEAARRFQKPDAFASKGAGGWVHISHERAVERVRHLSLGFHLLGIKKGDRIALLSESRPEWMLVDLAAFGCGAALVPIYPTLMADQAAYVLKDSDARVCVVSNQKQLDKVLSVLAETPSIEHILCVDYFETHADAPVMGLDEVESMGAERDEQDPTLADQLAAEVAPDDLATLIYTSGTTGQQKGVMLTHANIVSNIYAAFDHSDLIGPDDRGLSFLPLSHILERAALHSMLHAGSSIYFAQSIDTLIADAAEVKPTVMTSVPRLFEKMYERICQKGLALGGMKTAVFKRALRCGGKRARALHAGKRVSPLLEFQYGFVTPLVFAKWHELFGGRLRWCMSGGAPLAEEIAYAFLGAGIPIYEGYGLTETSPVIAMNRPGAYRIGTVGKPLKNIELQIAEDGEILVRGPSVTSGYYHLPEITAESFTPDGFFRTGDIGHLDEDGFLVITDRKKDLIKTSGGKYVAPQPIENAIKGSPYVAQAVVIGDRRKFCCVLIVPNFETLRAECASQGIRVDTNEDLAADPRVADLLLAEVDRLTPMLARYEKMKKVGVLPREMTIESGELTPTLKVKRRVVEERYRDLIDAIYSEADEKGKASHA